MCSEDWCSVGFPKHQKTLWIQKDNDWTILDIVYNNEHYTKQEFWNLVQGTQYEELSLKLKDKWRDLHFGQDLTFLFFITFLVTSS